MCDFCENITNEVNGDLSHKYAGLALVRDKDGKHCIVQEFVDDYGEMACLVSIPIKFCPMCGRKLSEETRTPSLRDRIIEKIKQTEPDYINYRDFYAKYGRVIPGIGDKWHWFENLTDEAKREGLLQITDMSDTELFDLYARINEDWEKTHSNQFWEDYTKDHELEKQLKAIETEKPSAEEILATLKEKLTEDEYLKLKASAEMFSDGINGLWEVMRKGIE